MAGVMTASPLKATIVRCGELRFDGTFSREMAIGASEYNHVDEHFRQGPHGPLTVWPPMRWNYALLQFNQTVLCGELAHDPSLYVPNMPGQWQWANDTLGLLFGYKEGRKVPNPVIMPGAVFWQGTDQYLSYIQRISEERNLAVKKWDWPWPDQCLFLIGYEIHSLVVAR